MAYQRILPDERAALAGKVSYVFLSAAMGISSSIRNVVVNAVLCWFYNGKKNAVVKVFAHAVILFRFYCVVDNS